MIKFDIMHFSGTTEHMVFFRRFAESTYVDLAARTKDIPAGFVIDDLSDADRTVFVNHADKMVILCVKGTDISRISDIMFDVALVLSLHDIMPQFKRTVEIARLTAKKYADHVMYACGHSSGAAQCIHLQHVLRDTVNILAVGFCAFLPVRHFNIPPTACLYAVKTDLISCTVPYGPNVHFVDCIIDNDSHSLRNFVPGDRANNNSEATSSGTQRRRKKAVTMLKTASKVLKTHARTVGKAVLRTSLLLVNQFHDNPHIDVARGVADAVTDAVVAATTKSEK